MSQTAVEIPASPPAASALPGETQRQLRILLVVESSAAGTGRHVLDLADGLLARGVDVHLLYATHRIDKLFASRVAKLSGLKSQTIDVGTQIHPRDFAALLAIRKYAKKHGPFDIIHGHSSKGGALARLSAFGTRAQSVYTIHGLVTIDQFVPPIQRAVYFSIEWLLSRMSARIIAVSPEEHRAAVACGMGEHRIICIPNGIEELGLTPRATARQTMGVGEEDIVVGFVGRLVDQKAPHILVGAFARASTHAPNARLAIVGSGPLEPALKETAESLGIADKVVWLGPRDARTVFAGYDVYAISSRKEGLPYVVLEALATGLPIVATNASGVEILVEHEKNGYIVPTDNLDAFARALTDLLVDPEKIRRFSEASKEHSKNFSVEGMVDKTLAAYRAIVEERDRMLAE